MESALAWIGQLAEWIGKFFPRWIILDPRVSGVKYVRGKRVVKLGPGIHWYWPLITTYDTYPTVRQTDNLVSQTLVTTDDQTVIVDGMIVYDVTDVEKLLTTVHHAVRAIQDISLTAVHDVCCNMTWQELKNEQRKGTLDTKLRNAAQKQLADYGVRVIKCMLTDLSNKVRVLRVVQSINKDPNV
jgi:regulator of protease activity HflC (stomatin/prohibitin superfamily)